MKVRSNRSIIPLYVIDCDVLAYSHIVSAVGMQTKTGQVLQFKLSITYIYSFALKYVQWNLLITS